MCVYIHIARERERERDIQILRGTKGVTRNRDRDGARVSKATSTGSHLINLEEDMVWHSASWYIIVSTVCHSTAKYGVVCNLDDPLDFIQSEAARYTSSDWSKRTISLARELGDSGLGSRRRATTPRKSFSESGVLTGRMWSPRKRAVCGFEFVMVVSLCFGCVATNCIATIIVHMRQLVAATEASSASNAHLTS